MKITRRADEADLIALRGWLKGRPGSRTERRKEYVVNLAGATLLAFIATVVPYYGLTQLNLWWTFPISVALAWAFWHPLYQMLDRKADQRFVQVNRNELGEQEFWADVDGFGNGTRAGSTFHRWFAVDEVHQAADFTFVLAHQRLYVLTVGADRDEYERFVAEMRRHREAASRAADDPVAANA